MAFSSSYCEILKPANTSLQRFDARYFTLDFPLSAIATVVADDPKTLVVNLETRSNRDLIGLLWNSKDRYGHPELQYLEDRDYRGLKLAFTAYPPDPYNFNLTLQANGQPWIYRLFPYMLGKDGVTVKPAGGAATGYGPGTTFHIDTLFPDGRPDNVVIERTSKNDPTQPAGTPYIFVVPFDDLRGGYDFDKARAPATGITQLFFSLVTPKYGIGRNARLRDAGRFMLFVGLGLSVTGTTRLTHWIIDGVDPQLNLKAGDVLSISMEVPENPVMRRWGKGKKKTKVPIYEMNFQTYDIQVGEWYGYGTTTRYVKMANDGGDMAWKGGPCQMTYLQEDTATGSESFRYEMKFISVTGSRRMIGRRYFPQPEHKLMMTSGFDDTYNITPWRHIQQTQELGYRGFFNIYMGMSHYFRARSYNENRKFKTEVIPGANPLNGPTVAWVHETMKQLRRRNMTCIWSTSFEILNSYMPDSWAQRDYIQRRALSGWVPPSSFISPNNPACVQYMIDVISHGMAIVQQYDPNLLFQIGEPWYWDGLYSNGAPCIYDKFTTDQYTEETGLAVPTPYIQHSMQPLEDFQRPYLEWLGVKLGQCTDAIRDGVKANFPTSKGTLLFFTPQIMNPAAEMLTIINYPKDNWKYPNYDFVQIEDYDWIIDGDLGRVQDTIDAATIELGYPLDVVHYFVGFVNTADQKWVWPNMNIALRDAITAEIPHLYVWAYPQVIRDGILYDDTVVGTDPAVWPVMEPSRQLPVGIEADVIRPVYFVQIGDDILMNSTDRNIDFKGKTWYGTGRFGAIQFMTESGNEPTSGWQMSLAGIPLHEMDTIAAEVRHKDCTLYMTLVDEANIPKFPPKIIGVGHVEDSTNTVTSNVITVSVRVRSKLASWSSGANARYSDEYQQIIHPGDRGFKYTAALVNQKLSWGKS